MRLKGILIPSRAFRCYEEYEDHRVHYSVPTILLSPVVNQCMRLDCQWLESMAVLCMGRIPRDGNRAQASYSLIT